MVKRFFFLSVILAIVFYGFTTVSPSALAAVVEGDQVVRYVDTPTGTVLYEGTAIDTAPVPEDQAESSYIPQGSSNLSKRPHKEKATASAIPEAPNFDSEVEAPAPKPKKNNNTLFIVIGAIAIIIGLGVILYIAKSREKK